MLFGIQGTSFSASPHLWQFLAWHGLPSDTALNGLSPAIEGIILQDLSLRF